MKPDYIHDLKWNQALAIAREACAQTFRDGGVPSDALRAFGLDKDLDPSADWSRAVEAIAEVLCQRPEQIAA